MTLCKNTEQSSNIQSWHHPKVAVSAGDKMFSSPGSCHQSQWSSHPLPLTQDLANNHPPNIWTSLQLLFLLCIFFFQSFLPFVCVQTHPSQAECLNPATFSLAQQAKKLSQTIRSGSKKKSFPWIVERKIRAKRWMFFLARRTQSGSCAPKATQIQRLYFPAFAIPSSFPFLTECFVLLYKEIWLNFNFETQKPLSEINTFFFFFFFQKRH